jgi:hypothetical protein
MKDSGKARGRAAGKEGLNWSRSRHKYADEENVSIKSGRPHDASYGSAMNN